MFFVKKADFIGAVVVFPMHFDVGFVEGVHADAHVVGLNGQLSIEAAIDEHEQFAEFLTLPAYDLID